MTLELASQLASQAIATCTAAGFNVSVVVDDRAGQERVASRSDMAGPHTLVAAREKAYTSASSRVSTQALGERSRAPGGPAYLTYIPGFLLLGGGVPVNAGGEVIGAIGVAGAPSGLQDERCALTAIELLKDKISPGNSH
ncbi:heme-binding protein [Variovorax paradoxus]|uniref:GlcG/HbpS family heme-binding protein n=1 Tax=Variovorax paradoxus TaxID=34073 RepID=UPI0021AC0EE6|nr:heme-binding protein [Variovorax paradoxus]UVH55135.1 heme-binding protein [Variovorax paradoxus]